MLKFRSCHVGSVCVRLSLSSCNRSVHSRNQHALPSGSPTRSIFTTRFIEFPRMFLAVWLSLALSLTVHGAVVSVAAISDFAPICAAGDHSLTTCRQMPVGSPPSVACYDWTAANNFDGGQGFGTYTGPNCLGSVCPNPPCDASCSVATSCSSCLSLSGCGWCAALNKCLYGGKTQSTSSNPDVCNRAQSSNGWLSWALSSSPTLCPAINCAVANCELCTANTTVCAVCSKGYVPRDAGAMCTVVTLPPAAPTTYISHRQSCVNWESIGPFRITGSGSSENVPLNPVAGAISAVIAVDHTAYVATVNGGIWKTTNLHTNDNTGTTVAWTPLFDASNLMCSSIGQFNMGVSNKNWLVAICSNPSNYAALASELNGGMVSLDAGLSCAMRSHFARS
jgi:hypothetical protein